MKYIVLFVVILVIMVAVNGLMFLMLKSLVHQLGDQLGSCLIHQMSFADEICEEKLQRINKLKEEEESYLGHTTAGLNASVINENSFSSVKTQPKAVVVQKNMSTVEEKASYVNSNLMKEYRYIKENFVFDGKKAINKVQELTTDTEKVRYSYLCGKMYDSLSDNIVFNLGLLPEEEQLEILKSSFDEECMEILEDLIKRENNLNVAKLRDVLKSEAELWQDEIVVHTPTPYFYGSDCDVKVVEDREIGEGMQIFRGSKMYDYSL